MKVRIENSYYYPDIIIESVPETPELKMKIFSQFNRLCPERTIFTTNTSTLLPSMIAEGTGRPEKELTTRASQAPTIPHPGEAQPEKPQSMG